MTTPPDFPIVGPSIEYHRLRRPSARLREERGWPKGTVIVDGANPAVPSDPAQRAEVEADERREVNAARKKRRAKRKAQRKARKANL